MTRECVFHSAPNTPSFPQSHERESTAHNIANICARYRSRIISTGLIKVVISPRRNFQDDRLDSWSQSKKLSFPQSFERESTTRNIANICARYRSRIISLSLIKVVISPRRNFQDDRLDSWSQRKNPSFPQSFERESTARNTADVGTRYRYRIISQSLIKVVISPRRNFQDDRLDSWSQSKNPSFPQSFERESTTRNIANICARYRSRIISTGLIKVVISPRRNFQDDRLDSWSQSKNPSFPQSFERESIARNIANICASYRSRIISTGLIKVVISPRRNFQDDRLDSWSQSKNLSFPQSFERESAARNTADVGTRCRSRIISLSLIKVVISPRRNFQDDRLDSWSHSKNLVIPAVFWAGIYNA
jgi:hypothetical protein